jgi:type VI secretion system protein VasJ
VQSITRTAMNEYELVSEQSMLLPIGDNEVGDDPRYGERFTLVKLEIDRLADNNYMEIARLCEKILQEEAKDLRVAGYYIMAKVFTEGLRGLIESVELYLELIKRYGNNCHPQRAIAKSQAIAWLNNEKLAAFVKKIEIPDIETRKSVSHFKSVLKRLNEELVACGEEVSVSWTSLNPWVEKNLPEIATEQSHGPAEGEVHSTNSYAESVEISSELTFNRSVDRLLLYLAEQADILRMIAVARALKWSASKLPNNESGITKIAPPREAVIAAVESSDQSDVNESRLIELESYFMESGCHFFFDLQMQEISVARALERIDVVELIESSIRQLLERLPDVINLSFSNGKPFANQLTKRWIKQLASKKQQTISADRTKSYAQSVHIKLTQIVEEVKVSGLASAIEKVSKIDSADKTTGFRIDLAKIDMCLNAERLDLALPIARKLEAQVERYHLAEWHKELALSLWNKLIIILNATESDSERRKEIIDDLMGKICVTDLGYALRQF